jgi:hypothetical protein
MTTDQMIAQIKRRVSVPSSQLKYGNADFIAFLNNAIESKIVPQLIDIDENFFVTFQDIPLVAGQTKYRVPNMAVCWSMHEVGFLNSAGNYRVLPRMTRGTERTGLTSSEPMGFYINDGYIVTTPDVGTTASGSLRVYYYRRLNELTLVSNCGRVTNVADGGVDWILTVDNAPLGVGSGADFIKGTSPYELIAIAQTVVVVGVVVTVAKAGFDFTPEIGDWIAGTGLTPVPHLPDAWHYVLADFGARKCMIGNVDAKTIQLLDSDIGDDLNGIKKVVQNRAKGSPRKRVGRNPILALHRR